MTTKVSSQLRLAVVGDPVEHSRSPAIHTVLLGLSGLEGVYSAIRADEQRLGEMVHGLKSGEWHGLNVTMPLKAAAAAMSQALSDDASAAGSVNTLSLRDGVVAGDSTDCSTFRFLIGRVGAGGSLPILVLGAGGSAAAALASIDSSRSVYVASRRPEQARGLVERLGGDVLDWGAALVGALVINTTPLGMAGETLPEGVLEMAAAMIDLPYGSKPTPAMITAEGLDLPRVDGHEFLIRQAIESFALWTGVRLDYERVRIALRKT